jgi:5-methylcytosine-specific restriction endonuclease McrA
MSCDFGYKWHLESDKGWIIIKSWNTSRREPTVKRGRPNQLQSAWKKAYFWYMSLKTPEAKATLDRIEAECNALGLDLPNVTGRQECSIARYNYLARTYNIPGQITTGEWESFKERFNYQCLCCRQDDIVLVPDFVISWFNRDNGGRNEIENVQPLCPKCNRLKGRRQYDYRIKWLAEEAQDIVDRTELGNQFGSNQGRVRQEGVRLELGLSELENAKD